MNRRHAVLGLALSATLAFAAPALAGENTVNLETKDGKITIELRPEIAPKHVKQLKTLISQGFYDGLKFHRVIDGFMAQTGDPNGNGTGGSDLPDVPAEFSKTARFKRGTVGATRSSSPNSANSQFFICFAEASNLDGQYTIWGAVTSGMDVVDKIKKGDPRRNGTVASPDKIVRMVVAADAK